MSRKQDKKLRRQKNSGTVTVDESATYVQADQICDYLRAIMRRFSGYNFISISKPQENNGRHLVEVKVHKYLPAFDEKGFYKSEKDQFVRFILTDTTGFEGLVMDRNKNCVFGDPFSQFKPAKKADVTLGEKPDLFGNTDDRVEPL